jgi:hypothetical protein
MVPSDTDFGRLSLPFSPERQLSIDDNVTDCGSIEACYRHITVLVGY